MASQKKIDEAFNLFDKDGNGTISAAELGEVFQSMGQQHTDDEIMGMLSARDKDCNGSLSKDEFATIVNCASGPDEQEMKEAFKVFDKDGNGFITKNELKQSMKEVGEHLSDAEINEMIRAADIDKDGNVCFAEFKKMMTPS